MALESESWYDMRKKFFNLMGCCDVPVLLIVVLILCSRMFSSV